MKSQSQNPNPQIPRRWDGRNRTLGVDRERGFQEMVC
jgi:hypothetical protein